MAIRTWSSQLPPPADENGRVGLLGLIGPFASPGARTGRKTLDPDPTFDPFVSGPLQIRKLDARREQTGFKAILVVAGPFSFNRRKRWLEAFAEGNVKVDYAVGVRSDPDDSRSKHP